jgi:hypothetical protein
MNLIAEYTFNFSSKKQLQSIVQTGLFRFSVYSSEPDPSDFLREWWKSIYSDYDFTYDSSGQILNWYSYPSGVRENILCSINLEHKLLYLYDEDKELVNDLNKYSQKIKSLIAFT